MPLLANLGAVQLNYGYGVEHCRRAVEMIGADALVLHLNPLQEALQPEGNGNFASLLPKMAKVVRELEVPVIAKEIGCGISARTAEQLARIGVRTIDVAGVGGTSWARIEASRSGDLDLGESFADWGIPTPDCIQELAAHPGAFDHRERRRAQRHRRRQVPRPRRRSGRHGVPVPRRRHRVG